MLSGDPALLQALAGGAFRNPHLVRFVSDQRPPGSSLAIDESPYLEAFGAAHLARREGTPLPPPDDDSWAISEVMRCEDMTACDPTGDPSLVPVIPPTRSFRSPSSPDVEHRSAQRLEGPGGDRRAHRVHQRDRPGDVVDREQARRRRLSHLEQMADVFVHAAQYAIENFG